MLLLFYLKHRVIPIFVIAILTRSSYQSSLLPLRNGQLKPAYLPDAKFGYNEYSEYPDNDESEKLPQPPSLPSREISKGEKIALAPVILPEELDPGITWDHKWPSAGIKFGQLSAVSLDPRGNVVVFHRGSRIWDTGSFDLNEVFDREKGPVRENTVVVISSAGEKIGEWGRSLFYLPHGLTVDHLGNYWITDVGMHQVFKFNAKDVAAELKTSAENNATTPSTIKPALSLGDPFVPGNDKTRFCKPTAVAVQRNGDFFVSDGYCNSRIIKFNANGERILTWGRKWVFQENLFGKSRPMNAFWVPHALALAEELEFIFVADRENGRILCFHSNNGTFHKEYRHPLIGSRIFSVSYARERLYLVNGEEFNPHSAHVRGFVIDINTGLLQAQFVPSKDMQKPHDIAVSNDGKSIYIVELDPYRIYRFSQDTNSSLLLSHNVNKVNKVNQVEDSGPSTGTRPSLQPQLSHESMPLKDLSLVNTNSKLERRSGNETGVTATTIILSLVTAAVVLVALCVAIAAIVARCRKRGCLMLTMRRGMRWESADRRENFKLSNLLESRKSKGGRKFFEKRPNTRDFSKLNTEPETSDDENNLTKII